jgi:hypothetical protein
MEPFAGHLATRNSTDLARSALPGAPVQPPPNPRTPRVRPALAAGLRWTAHRLASLAEKVEVELPGPRRVSRPSADC